MWRRSARRDGIRWTGTSFKQATPALRSCCGRNKHAVRRPIDGALRGCDEKALAVIDADCRGRHPWSARRRARRLRAGCRSICCRLAPGPDRRSPRRLCALPDLRLSAGLAARVAGRAADVDLDELSRPGDRRRGRRRGRGGWAALARRRRESPRARPERRVRLVPALTLGASIVAAVVCWLLARPLASRIGA